MFRFLLKLLALGAGVGLVLLAFTHGDVDVLLKGATPLKTVVRDDANVLSDAQRWALRDTHMKLLNGFGVDVRVLTVPGAVDIAAVAADAFRKHAVGKRSRTGEGVLFVVAPQSNAAWVEASPRTAAALGDVFMTYLKTRQMAPFFRRDRLSDGIVASLDLIYQRAVAVRERQAFDPRKQDLLSAAAAGILPETAPLAAVQPSPAPRLVAASSSPDEVLRAYMHAMRNHDDRHNLPIYSSATREMLLGEKQTPEQMDAVTALSRTCSAGEMRFAPDGGHAVIRYAINERACLPWLFLVEDGAWRLDLFARTKLIRLDTQNQWFFAFGLRNDYQAAFADWLFDADGYPQER